MTASEQGVTGVESQDIRVPVGYDRHVIGRQVHEYKTSFEKDQRKYDKLFKCESKKVVHAEPRLSKDQVALLEQ